MQTFLPFASFRRSAAVLDNKRLGKQRVETLQVMNVFGGVREGWGNHPITNMWRGYECALMTYQLRTVEAWVSRVSSKGKPMNDTCLEKTWLAHESNCRGLCAFSRRGIAPPTFLADYAPWWLGDARLHTTHQANLVRKAPELYGPVWPRHLVEQGIDPDTVGEAMPAHTGLATEYWWPVPKIGQTES